MVIAAVIAICIVLLVLAFLAPRLSRHPERATQRTLGTGGRLANLAPGKIGHWFAKPFRSSSKATARSAGAGRRGRGKLPL